MSNWRSCGICCLGFSLFAIIFLVVVGAVLRSGSDTISIDEAKRESAAHNCTVGAAIYGGFVGVSLLCIFLPGLICKPKKEDEEALLDSLDEYRVR